MNGTKAYLITFVLVFLAGLAISGFKAAGAALLSALIIIALIMLDEHVTWPHWWDRRDER